MEKRIPLMRGIVKPFKVVMAFSIWTDECSAVAKIVTLREADSAVLQTMPAREPLDYYNLTAHLYTPFDG